MELLAEALHRSVVRHYRIINLHSQDSFTFLINTKNIVANTLTIELNRLHFIKFGIGLDTTFKNTENEISNRGFITRNKTIIQTSDVDAAIEECLQELVLKITEHEARGSSWSLF
ncbi:hypothetical protein, partial [Klebsiella pneumoniae]|uniref:hypothetical protein n=1 Tax=Klebsiella pneumoniae TaxID=573 RepID=UPI001C8F537C